MMASGRATARSIAEQYIARIEEIDRRGPTLHAVIELNADACEQATKHRRVPPLTPTLGA